MICYECNNEKMEVKFKSRYPKVALLLRLAGGLLILPIPLLKFVARFSTNPNLNLFYREIHPLALELFLPGAVLLCLGIILETYRNKVYYCTQCGARVEIDR